MANFPLADLLFSVFFVIFMFILKHNRVYKINNFLLFFWVFLFFNLKFSYYFFYLCWIFWGFFELFDFFYDFNIYSKA
jgi:hypothetical protein